MRLLLLATALLLVPLAARAQDPAPAPPQAPGLVDLRARLEAALQQVNDPARFHAGNAEALLARGYEELFAIDPARLDMAKVDAEPEALNRLVFDLTLAVDRRCAELHDAGQARPALGEMHRRVLRGLRFLREQVLLRAARLHPDRLYAGGRPGFARVPPTTPGLDRYHWTVNPAHFERLFRADQLPRTFFIINEGDMTLSAAIARSGSEDNMFSHYSVGYVTDREHVVRGKTYPAGTLLTIESLIERGVVIEPFPYHFQKALKGWSAREAVLFLRDQGRQPALDAAADAFFERVKAALNAGRPLGYDFSMGHAAQPGLAGALGGEAPAPRLLDMSKFFCSGVAEALGQAAGVELFTYRTRLEQGRESAALFRRWGLDPDRPIPAPGDGDVSAALVRVAEGVNLARLEDAHLRHAVLERMFTWIDRDGYLVVAPAWFRSGTQALTRLNDQVAGTILDLGLVPNGITPEIMQSLLPIHHAAEAYLKRLRVEEAASREARGRSLTPAEMAAFLEQVRPEVDVDRWFVRGAAGRYELSAGRRRSRLVVERHDQGLRVVREVLEDDRVVARGEGEAVQQGRRLRATFTAREGEHPERLTWTLERDGRIAGRLSPLRVERGRRAE